MLRLSATTLESYRLFRDGDWMTFEQLKADLEGFKETPLMRRGTSLHAILETPEQYAIDGDHSAHGFRWTGLDRYLKAMPFGVHEVKATLVIDTPSNGPIQLVGKADMLQGLIVREFKTTKQFSAQKYLDSMQWRIYLMAFGAPACVYTVFEVEGGEEWPVEGSEALCTVKSANKMELFAYDGMANDVTKLVDEFVSFARETGLQPRGLREVA